MCVNKDGKEDGMDTPGFASPIRVYSESLQQMRRSNDVIARYVLLVDSMCVPRHKSGTSYVKRVTLPLRLSIKKKTSYYFRLQNYGSNSGFVEVDRDLYYFCYHQSRHEVLESPWEFHNNPSLNGSEGHFSRSERSEKGKSV